MSSADGLEAHLWVVDLEINADPTQIGATLSQGERDRAAAFVFDRDRERFVAARTALRSILAAYVDIPAHELEFEYGLRGKPALAPWCRGKDLRFNLSHSEGCALVALARGVQIGVDVEKVRHLNGAGAIVAGEFSAAERAVFEALPMAARGEAFCCAWVRKEAFLKATGEGLSRSLADIEVTFARHEPARLLAVSGDFSAPQRWVMRALTPRPGYVGAFVAEAPAVALSVHSFQEPFANVLAGDH